MFSPLPLPSRRATARWLAPVLFASIAWGCLPSQAAFLRVPFGTPTPSTADDRMRIRVPLAELQTRLPTFDPESVAFYTGGRTPRPFRRIDTDGDGAVDVFEVDATLAGGADALVIVSPGPAAAGEPPSSQLPLLPIDFTKAHK